MSAALPPLIPADLRVRLQALQLRARRGAGAPGIGVHTSRSRGSGLEFAQYRSYAPGDAPHRIDWRLYARSDRFFVREAEGERPLTLWLLVDATASAAQADLRRPEYTRLDAIKTLAACAAELALRQGDRFGLLAVSGDKLELLPAGSGLRQRDRLWLALQRLRAHGRWPPLAALRPAWERSVADDLLLAIGDGFDEDADRLLQRLAAARRDVRQLQVLSCDERDFPFAGGHRFVDPETGEAVAGDGVAMRADYLHRFAQAQRARIARWQAAGIRHATHYLDEAADAALHRLLDEGGRR